MNEKSARPRPVWPLILAVTVALPMTTCGACVCLGGIRRAAEGGRKVAAVPAASARSASSAPAASQNASEAASAASALARKCAVGVPGDRDASVPIFPTKEGMDEWMRAVVAGDTRAAQVIRRAQQAVIVQGGTACSVIDYGMIHSQVRILEGANEGSAGWVAPEWTHAAPVVIAGIAIAAAAGAGTHALAITFNIAEDPEGEKNWIQGIRGFDVTAAALGTDPESTWTKVGAGDRVAFECDSRPSVKELVGCKLTHFEDTNLKPAPLSP